MTIKSAYVYLFCKWLEFLRQYFHYRNQYALFIINQSKRELKCLNNLFYGKIGSVLFNILELVNYEKKELISIQDF